MIATYSQCGRMALAQGRRSEADEWFHRSLTAAEAIGDRVAICKNLLELSRSAMLHNQFDAAANHLNRALVEARAVGQSRDIADVLLQLGTLALAQWRFTDAEASISEAVELHIQAGNWHAVTGCLRILVATATAHGHKRDALTWAVRCAHVARSHPSVDFSAFTAQEALVELIPLIAPERLPEFWQQVTGEAMPTDLLSTITTRGERMPNPPTTLTMNVKFTARAAAQRLAPEIDRRIPHQVDALIEAQSDGGQAVQFGADAVEIAGLVVSSAQLAWAILTDLRQRRVDVTPQALADRVRQETPDVGASDQVRDQVIAIVVEEILNDEF
jgi:hypothetical protein